MKAISIKPIASAVLLSTLLAASVSFAQSSATSSVRPYDGQQFDSTTGHSTSSAPIDTSASNYPGSYAQYLISIGTSREEAMKAAYNVDHRQPSRAAEVAVDTLASDQPGPYAKYLMHIGLSQEEAVNVARDIDIRQERTANRIAHTTRSNRDVTR